MNVEVQAPVYRDQVDIADRKVKVAAYDCAMMAVRFIEKRATKSDLASSTKSFDRLVTEFADLHQRWKLGGHRERS